MSLDTTPPEGTVERWAFDYVVTTELAHKLDPPPMPRIWEEPCPAARRLVAPGRPAELTVVTKSPKSGARTALRSPLQRARLFHAFLHHELQAAELMAWAILAFPNTPRAFRRGLGAVLADEARHMRHYADYLAGHGVRFGDFPVRDWFWQRVPSVRSPAHFVAVMGMGFEAGNLDHTARFAARLREAGDERGAALQDRIGAEEIPHVRFAVRWFHRWAGDDFSTWAEHLPLPLSPLVMRGHALDRERRRRGGLSDAFLRELEAWRPA